LQIAYDAAHKRLNLPEREQELLPSETHARRATA
jgi:hypothetical protein